MKLRRPEPANSRPSQLEWGGRFHGHRFTGTGLSGPVCRSILLEARLMVFASPTRITPSAAICAVVVAVALFPRLCQADDSLSFNRDIRPILSDTCFFCHGPDAGHREADLRLDVEADAKDWAIVGGDPDASELVSRIVSTDPELVMPPPDSGKRLTRDQIGMLTTWVEQGAPYETAWAYVPPRRHDAVETDSSWPSDRLDQFVLSGQRSHGLRAAADADPVTLLRRLSLDLTGLPPSAESVKAFSADPRSQAYRASVDRLLASPAFGERMASYWLDLVRFADTVGYHGDQDHNISPYRDYVIDAFNEDMPFDQFTREQLAGDLLEEPTESQRVATGYNRLLQTSHEGGVQPKEYLSIYAADRIRNLSGVWLGATVGCAQCHDHKYDPFTITDFYSLAAFFADVDEAQHFKVGSNALPTRRPPELEVLAGWERGWLNQIERAIRHAKETGADEQTLDQLRKQRDAVEARKRTTMVTVSIDPREIRVLPRGDWLDDSGPVVRPAVPAFLGSIHNDAGDSTAGAARANRADLADWLLDPDRGVGGLTARVLVNRLWYLTFGRGISSSLADFGGQGVPPTHPELLDELSLDFIETGWSVKAMIRRLVLSRAYRQSSVATAATLRSDPENHWFARQSRYRLDAEFVRDHVLDCSGLLIRRVGGASVKPHQPAGYYRHLNFPRRLYSPSRGADQYRRGVYVHWQRQFLHPMLKAMDAPSREECTAQRPRSNTPLEALVMLNDPSMVDAAIAMAARLLQRKDLATRDRLTEGFRLTLSRKPETAELDELERLLDQERAHYADHVDDAQALIDSADRQINTEAHEPVELAAWVSVTRALLNLYESIARY